jgi:hypothetical protein
MTEIIMALGDLLFEEKGKQISSRTVDSMEPTAEISGIGNTKYKDENMSTHWTISVKLGQNGVSYAHRRGIMYAENNEVATYSINGIGKANNSSGGSSSSSRGVSMFHTNASSINENCLRLMIWLQFMN